MKETKGDVEENEMKSKPRMESKPQLLIDFTGDPEESRYRSVFSALGDNRVTSASKVDSTGTDETDGKKFEKQYKLNEVLKYGRAFGG